MLRIDVMSSLACEVGLVLSVIILILGSGIGFGKVLSHLIFIA